MALDPESIGEHISSTLDEIRDDWMTCQLFDVCVPNRECDKKLKEHERKNNESDKVSSNNWVPTLT